LAAQSSASTGVARFSIANARAGVAIAEVFVDSASAFMARAPAFDVSTSVKGIVEVSLLAKTTEIVARDGAGGAQSTVKQPKDNLPEQSTSLRRRKTELRPSKTTLRS
jgi:hypothetical protein